MRVGKAGWKRGNDRRKKMGVRRGEQPEGDKESVNGRIKGGRRG